MASDDDDDEAKKKKNNGVGVVLSFLVPCSLLRKSLSLVLRGERAQIQG